MNRKRGNMPQMDDIRVQFIEALPVLAKLQQQEEKIEEMQEKLRDELKYRQECLRSANIEINSLKQKITELEKQLADMNRDCISLFLHEQRMKQLETRIKGMILSLQTHGQNIDVKFHIDWLKEVLSENR